MVAQRGSGRRIVLALIHVGGEMQNGCNPLSISIVVEGVDDGVVGVVAVS